MSANEVKIGLDLTTISTLNVRVDITWRGKTLTLGPQARTITPVYS